MKFQNILALCDKNDWVGADAILKQLIKQTPDQPEAYAMAAHVILRQGNTKAASWLINKAQSYAPDNAITRIEDICLDFYEARHESAYRKISPVLLKNAPHGHPFHHIAAYLCCLYNDVDLYKHIPDLVPWNGLETVTGLIDNYLLQERSFDPLSPWERADYSNFFLQKLVRNPGEGSDSQIFSRDPLPNPLPVGEGTEHSSWNAVPHVLFYLEKNDKLFACIIARYTEIFFPAEANSFAALGIFNLYAGFFKNAERNFHEAFFRETEFANLIHLQQFYLFCRQQRFSEAINIALHIEQSGNLDAKGQAFLLEAMLRSGYNLESIRKRLEPIVQHLKQINKPNPYIEVVKLRVALFDEETTALQLIQMLKPYVSHADCNAAFLYFYAELIGGTAQAKEYLARAFELDSLYPDAGKPDSHQVLDSLNFEYAGLFIPKEHEGGALPTKTQMELLDILFLLPDTSLCKTWQEFTENHSLYKLEAGAARLLPFIYKKLSGSLTNNEIAEIDLLKGIWKKSYFENALQMKNILQVVQLLEKNNIEVVLLKGMANALSLYDDLGSRPMSDIDILINQAHLISVDGILREHGWKCKDIPNPERIRFSYASTYRHANGSIVDVHWRPCENLNADFFDVNDIWELKHTIFMGHKWATLSPTINLLCTILHGVEWNHLSPVRWVSDALLILNKFPEHINWQKIYNLAQKYHCLPILATGLQFLTRYNKDFTSNLPDGLSSAIGHNYEDDILMKVRLRSRSHLGSFEEALAVLECFKKRFVFKENDHLFICGGNKPEYIKSQCEKLGIYWAAHFDNETMLAVKPTEAPYNFIAIDANLSCSFQCISASFGDI